MDNDVDNLTQSLATMANAMEVNQKSTADILGILERVDERLASLEQNMGPIRRVTEQLTTAEHNVIKAYDKMKKLHENFRIVADAEATVRKGFAPNRSASPATLTPSNSGVELSFEDEDPTLAAYLEVADRVHEAMVFLRRNIKMRSADATLRQLEQKQQKLLTDLKDEVYRLLTSGSQCSIAKTHRDYQMSDPISASVSRKVKVVIEAMMRSHDSRWTEAYVRARRAKLETAIKHFMDTRSRPESGAAPDATLEPQAEWLRYMQFLRELVRGEEVLFARAVPRSKEGVAALVELINPPVVKICGDATEALDQLVARERGPGDKAIILLSLLKGLKHEMPAFSATLRMQPGGEALPPLDCINRVYGHLASVALGVLTAFADDVQTDSTATKNLPPNAGVHVITSNTIRAFKRIMPFEDVFEELAASQDLPWETDDDRADDEESRLRIFAHHLFHCLLANLRQKADAYGKMDGADTLSGAGRPYLFLMNNAQYILKAIKGDDVKDAQQRSPTGAQIVSVLADAFVDRLAGLVDETREKYNKAVFVPLAQHTRQTDLPLEYNKGSSILTLDSGRQIKSRFTAFNSGLEEIYQHQKPYSVPDVALRQRLRQDGRSIVLSSYTEFFERFSQVHFSKKHMDQYLKFPPKAVGTMIDELYSG